MNTKTYLNKFENAVNAFDKKVLEKSGLEIQTDLVKLGCFTIAKKALGK